MGEGFMGGVHSPEAESVKGCCAEVIFGPKLSVDQNKSQGIQKVDLKHFKFNYHCSTFYNLFGIYYEVYYNLEN